ncbi:hypothetical protein INR49_023870 [Caranx melampygus]|nr:hypothetical protein INR49_023870 [Caranx melampygus]
MKSSHHRAARTSRKEAGSVRERRYDICPGVLHHMIKYHLSKGAAHCWVLDIVMENPGKVQN